MVLLKMPVDVVLGYSIGETLAGNTPLLVRLLECSRSDISGAQVQKDNNDDDRRYIVPFCALHN